MYFLLHRGIQIYKNPGVFRGSVQTPVEIRDLGRQLSQDCAVWPNEVFFRILVNPLLNLESWLADFKSPGYGRPRRVAFG